MVTETTRASRDMAGLTTAVLLMAAFGLFLGCGRAADESGEKSGTDSSVETGDEGADLGGGSASLANSKIEVRPCSTGDDSGCVDCGKPDYERLYFDHRELKIGCSDFELGGGGKKKCKEEKAKIKWQFKQFANAAYTVSIRHLHDKSSSGGHTCSELYGLVDGEPYSGPSFNIDRDPGFCEDYPASWPYEVVLEAKDDGATSYCADPEIIIDDDSDLNPQPGPG